MKTTNVRFCDIAIGTEYCLCDPDTVAPGVEVPRFKKTGPNRLRGSAPARYLNLKTGQDRPVTESSTIWSLPVWPQTPSPEEKKEIEELTKEIYILKQENGILRERQSRVKRQLDYISRNL